MKTYEINGKTLALVPIGKKKTLVYEDHDCFTIDEKISKLMDENCQYNGSSISGRLKGTYNLTGFSYKAPIILSENKHLIFFPTSSPRLKDCSWINTYNVKKLYKTDEKCLIEFNNNESIELDFSYHVLTNQFRKSLELDYAYKKREN